MKRIFLIIALFVLTFGLSVSNAQTLADIQFEKMDHNFGRIREEGGPAVFNFKFTNTGKVPLILQGVEASCGCTTPEWSQEPILPGKTGMIKVSFDPDQRPGAFAKSITINANVPKTTRVLTISGEVIEKNLGILDHYPVNFGNIRLSASDLSFVRIKDNEIKTDTIKLYNPGTSPVSVNFKIIPPHILIKSFPEILPPKSTGYFLVTFDATRKPVYGFVTNRIYMSFNDEDNFKNAITISGTIEEDFSRLSTTDLENGPRIDYDSRVFDFREIPQGKTVENTFKILNKGRKDLIIRSVTASCGCTTGKLSSNTIPPGGTAELKVSFDSTEKVGMQNKIITIISNDPQHSTTLLRVIGTVKK